MKQNYHLVVLLLLKLTPSPSAPCSVVIQENKVQFQQWNKAKCWLASLGKIYDLSFNIMSWIHLLKQINRRKLKPHMVNLNRYLQSQNKQVSNEYFLWKFWKQIFYHVSVVLRKNPWKRTPVKKEMESVQHQMKGICRKFSLHVKTLIITRQ